MVTAVYLYEPQRNMNTSKQCYPMKLILDHRYDGFAFSILRTLYSGCKIMAEIVITFILTNAEIRISQPSMGACTALSQ